MDEGDAANGSLAIDIDTHSNGESAAAANGSDKHHLHRYDSFLRDADKVSGVKYHGNEGNWIRTISLAFQSIGIVYGDIGTSPLYVYSSTFPDGIKNKDDLLGVLSLIIYTLIIIPMCKYVFIVLYANDNGDGGTFALYSLITRYAKASLIPNQQAEDAMVSNFKLEAPNSQLKRAQWIKGKLENNIAPKIILFLLTILGTSMVMGDGTLTPSISVLSAVSGIREKVPVLNQDQVVGISVVVLFLLFSVQSFGTDKVGYSFAPIVLVWFIMIGTIGFYNMIVQDISILRAFNPLYIIDYFRRNGKDAWVSLGGVVLCITGTEAMFADLGHFNIRAIQLSFSFILFPSVTFAYIGQAAYLWNHPEDVADTFYRSIPDVLFWPMFIVAILAAIIASQAMLSGAFAIISKALTLGCFPRVKVTHTSHKYEGQVFIPEINFLIGCASICVTLLFRTTTNIGNAYGICVIVTMLVTTHLMTVIMLLIWKTNVICVIIFYLVFGLTEFTYLSSILAKFVEGGYLPFAFSLVLMSLMATWTYVNVKKYYYELDRIVTSEMVRELVVKNSVHRVPGVGLLYTELVQGIPPIFPHLIERMPTLHSVFVFVSIKHLPIPHVQPPERLLFRQVEPRQLRMFRCVARYGYMDVLEDSGEFAAFLVDRLKFFIDEEYSLAFPVLTDGEREEEAAAVAAEAVAEKRLIEREKERGVVYLMSEAEVTAAPRSPLFKKMVVNYLYTFLRKNLRQGDKALSIPKNQLLKVGITYEI